MSKCEDDDLQTYVVSFRAPDPVPDPAPAPNLRFLGDGDADVKFVCTPGMAPRTRLSTTTSRTPCGDNEEQTPMTCTQVLAAGAGVFFHRGVDLRMQHLGHH